MEKVIKIEVTIFIFVEKLEDWIEICLFDVIDLVISQEVTNVLSVDNISSRVLRSSLNSLEGSIRLEVKLPAQLLSLLLYYCLIFRNCFQVQV